MSERVTNPSSLLKTSADALFERFSIAAVIPAYNVERHIEDVLTTLPRFLRHIIVVDDGSMDRTRAIVEFVASQDSRIILESHDVNRGVGGAMITGFRRALELGAQIIVKIDGDGQMSPDFLPDLLLPLIRGEADYTKGNRFRDFRALRHMPPVRRVGNMALSFLAKAATGYWNCFDPTNGFVAIRGDVLSQIPLENIQRSYFFEISMLSELYLLGAVIRDIPMPARYGDETSNLSVNQVVQEFPMRLLRCLCRRLVLKNFIYDFTMESVYLLCGLPMLLAGVLYGGVNWIRYARMGIGAPTGTIVISALLIILGFQILLAAISLDLQSVPRHPICGGPLHEMSSNHADHGDSLSGGGCSFSST